MVDGRVKHDDGAGQGPCNRGSKWILIALQESPYMRRGRQGDNPPLNVFVNDNSNSGYRRTYRGTQHNAPLLLNGPIDRRDDDACEGCEVGLDHMDLDEVER